MAREVRELPKERHLTQKQLAAASGINQAEISRIERGQTNPHQLIRGSRLHLTMEEWARRYGPIFRVDIGPRRLVGISGTQAINSLLRDRPEGFRRWSDQQMVFQEMGINGVFTAEGEDWKRQRRFVVTGQTGSLSDTHRPERVSAGPLPKACLPKEQQRNNG